MNSFLKFLLFICCLYGFQSCTQKSSIDDKLYKQVGFLIELGDTKELVFVPTNGEGISDLLEENKNLYAFNFSAWKLKGDSSCQYDLIDDVKIIKAYIEYTSYPIDLKQTLNKERCFSSHLFIYKNKGINIYKCMFDYSNFKVIASDSCNIEVVKAI